MKYKQTVKWTMGLCTSPMGTRHGGLGRGFALCFLSKDYASKLVGEKSTRPPAKVTKAMLQDMTLLMGKFFLYAAILLWTMPDLLSGITYNNKGDHTSLFSCYSPGHLEGNDTIKLFLTSGDLVVHCYFLTRDRPSEIRQHLIKLFTSRGLAPTFKIMNSTYSGVFHFNLSMNIQEDAWFIIIPRETITFNTEPILQWQLGEPISHSQFIKMIPHVKKIKIAKCPCANDVVILGIVCDHTYEGVYLGLTYSGFWDDNGTSWYNLTENICSALSEDCLDFSFVDVVLTNHHLILLTSLGLFISEDLRYPKKSLIKFSRANFCGFEREDYERAKLWYQERCLANREQFEDDFIAITFDKNKTLSQTSTCFYGLDPFIFWRPCLPKVTKKRKIVGHRIISFLIDSEQKTGIYLLKAQDKISVAVRALHNSIPQVQVKFPSFKFPNSFSLPLGMVFHPRSHFLYVYGNQVWLSTDGGNSFVVLGYMSDDPIQRTYHSFYSADIIFLSVSSTIHLSKAGLRTYTQYGKIKTTTFEIYYDHVGIGILVTLKSNTYNGVNKEPLLSTSALTSMDGNVALNTSLAPQYLTATEIIFFAYEPIGAAGKYDMDLRFSHIHLGKQLRSNSAGFAHIMKIMKHDHLVGFPTSAFTEVLKPFKIELPIDSPCLWSFIVIEKDHDPFYRIKLQLNDLGNMFLFRRSDILKTIVIPGYSSFLLIKLPDYKTALALATMPTRVPLNKTFKSNEWFIYDFSMHYDSTWSISPTICNHWIQHDDIQTSKSIVKYMDLGASYTFKIKIIPRISKGAQLFQMPHVEVFAGRPNLMEIKSLGYWDDTDSYIIEITTINRYLRQGMTSISFVVWQASTFCYTTTIILTLKSSCSYIKTMYLIPNQKISMSDWETGIHKNQYGFNMIKTLPENYRPPSQLGIAIPLTDNFYNADPSKPKPRNLFPESKVTGKYKQCLNKSSRADCNCSIVEKFSYSTDFSDCREKVPRYKFPVSQYPISLNILSEDHKELKMEPPFLVTVTEVNQRGNWKIKQHVPETMMKLKKYVENKIFLPVYNPKNLNLSITGSELFHFRVVVIPGVTFCNFYDEFQIYVDDVPLPFPGRILIATTTAVLLGGIIYLAFILEIYNVQVWKPFKNMIRKKKGSIQPIRIVSED
ncbi:cation channel sperm-associated protein subunit beta isoform X2 [Sarcophilus harrisii]|uniref:cation channel sperm-associated protein subunit beta isoform X2 n=1 Tax=Sarcophilus harrisii TaxID=9305 RepID=UPI001301AD87|nr:cation channel sperm-associated protein subunit beta isoform X2 [Sarcophilus harrisii]